MENDIIVGYILFIYLKIFYLYENLLIIECFVFFIYLIKEISKVLI